MQDSLAIIETTDRISDSARKNILQWLTEEKYSYYKDELVGLILNNEWQLLEDNFFKILPFGTGGRRGTVGIGSARVNRVTIGETVQALCTYLKEVYSDEEISGVAIACDSRLTSKEFSEYCAEVLAANKIKAYIFDGPRATPELSFTVRYLKLSAGIVITASHNPSSDNGIKLYWKDGGQLVPPHDSNILLVAEESSRIAHMDFEEAKKGKLVETIGSSVDAAYFNAVLSESRSKNRDLVIAYSSLHGTGVTSVYPVLLKAGFDVRLYEPQANLDGNFTNVTNHISNPESPNANDKLCMFTLQQGADIAISNDPDADRYCVLARVGDDMVQLNGNQAAVLMTDYLLAKEKKNLTSKHFISSTIVTTDMLDALATHYGIRSVSNLLVGFKYIGEQVHIRCDNGDEIFVCGGEESYGGVVGTYARDKDGASPSLVLAELAAELKKENKTLQDKLNELYMLHGYYHEELDSVFFYGARGSDTMKSFMHEIRSNPPRTIAGVRVSKIRDYIAGEEILGRSEDVLRIEFGNDEKNRITIRPSGTEPKLKIYTQLYSPIKSTLEEVKRSLSEQARLIKEEILTRVATYNE